MLRPVRGRQEVQSPEDFWSFVSKNVTGLGCWMWHGVHADGDKVPHVAYQGVELPVWALAHQLLGRSVETDTVGIQTCPVPRCVNPDHWELRWKYRRDVLSPNRSPEHCASGHPLAGANLIYQSGRRDCFACTRADKLRQRARVKHKKEVPLPPGPALQAEIDRVGIRVVERKYGTTIYLIKQAIKIGTLAEMDRARRG